MIAGFTGHDQADKTVKSSLRRLGINLTSRANSAPVAAILENCDITGFSASDADDEVRHIVREVIAATYRASL